MIYTKNNKTTVETSETIELFKQFNKIIKKGNNFLLTTHLRSDPDGISCELALYYLLESMGKKVTIINDAEYPKSLNFLFKDEYINGKKVKHISFFTASEYELLDEKYDFDIVLILDSPNIQRLGKVVDFVPEEATKVNIDHHISNEQFADVNIVFTDASSTGEIIYTFFKETGIHITQEIANPLYTSIITDTGRFIHSNTSSKCLLAAADLIDCGATPAEIGKNIYQTNSHSMLILQSMAISTIKLEFNGRVSVLWLTKEMIKKSGVEGDLDSQDFSEIPASIENVSVGIFLKELENSNEIKVSLRSKNNVDVNKIANKFGGGGHIKASGCEIAGTISEVHKIIVDAVGKELD